MDHATNHIADLERRGLAFALDALGLQHARPEAERTLREIRLQQSVAALRAENHALRARLEALERQLSQGTPTLTPLSARSTAARPEADPASPGSDLVWSSR